MHTLMVSLKSKICARKNILFQSFGTKNEEIVRYNSNKKQKQKIHEELLKYSFPFNFKE